MKDTPTPQSCEIKDDYDIKYHIFKVPGSYL